MGWIVVKQPNDNYAVFSSVVDHFIVWDATRDEIEAFLIEEAVQRAKAQAASMIKAADEDQDRYKINAPRKGDGLKRWRECLGIVRGNHGKAEVHKILRAVDTGNFEAFYAQEPSDDQVP